MGFHLERHSRHLRAADKTYEVTLDREGWPVREIDSGTGEIVTFDRGPEKVFGQIPMSRRRLLTLHAAAERGRSTGMEVTLGKYAHVATFRDGLMVHWKAYTSQSKALEAAGLRE